MGLITIQEYQNFANVPDPEELQKQTWLANINVASQMIEQLTGRDFDQLSDTSPMPDTIEYFRGTGRDSYYTVQAPLISVDKIEYWDGSAWNDVDDENIDFTFTNDPGGELGKVMMTDGNKFFKIKSVGHEWRVTYTYGYAAIPYEIKMACKMIVKWLCEQGVHQGIRNQSDSEQSYSYDHTFPQAAMDIIDRYKRYSG